MLLKIIQRVFKMTRRVSFKNMFVDINLLITNIFSFKVDLYIGGEMKSSGFGTSLQRAELDAANKAVQQISKEFVDCYPKTVSKNYYLVDILILKSLIAGGFKRSSLFLHTFPAAAVCIVGG